MEKKSRIVGAPIFYILQLTSGAPIFDYSAYSLTGACTKKHKYMERGVLW